MEFVLFGHVRATHQGQPVELGRRQERCLLGLLLIEAGRAVNPDRLAELLWDGSPPSRARGVIQTYVARLRRQLAPSGVAIASNSGGYCVEVAAEDVDLHRFQLAVTAARQVGDPGQRADLLAAALELWHGPVLGSVASDQLRARVGSVYEEMRLAAIEQCAEAYLRGGSPDRAVLVLAAAGDDHPVREETVRLRMTALAAAGRKAESLAAYRAARLRLRQELGLEPGRELRLLHEQILRSDHRPGFAGPAGPQPPTVLGPDAGRRPAPQQLPPDLEVFAGRRDVLKELDGLAPGEPKRGRGGPGVLVVHGTAGVGKTALAIHWAHRVARRYPDGQLYLNLRGHEPTGTPMSVAEAVRTLLDAIAGSSVHVPAGLDAQIGLYRSLLVGRRLLIVLDNARESSQVRPLLPGSPGCLVIVTSRNQMTGLVANPGARTVSLDIMSHADARELLTRRLGPGRIEPDPTTVAEIIDRCGRLPLALSVFAATAAARPTFPLRSWAEQLRGDLDAFDGGDPGTDVRAVFSWSYRGLGTEPARLFRLLGGSPCADYTTSAAASLANAGVRTVRPWLAELARGNLITEHLPGRYTMHDLLRAYAGELHSTVDSNHSRRAAARRLLDGYLDTAVAAVPILDSHRHPPATPSFRRADRTTPPATCDEATRWFSAERVTLVTLVGWASEHGFDAHAWQLAWTLKTYFERRGHTDDWLSTQRCGAMAADRMGDPMARAVALRGIATALGRDGQIEASLAHTREALELSIALNDRAGEATAHFNMAGLLERQSRHDEALEHARRAVTILGGAGDQRCEGCLARMRNVVAWINAQLGRYREALVDAEVALAQVRREGHLLDEACTLDTIAYAYEGLGDRDAATMLYRQAVDLMRAGGDRYMLAEILGRLGDCRRAAGDHDGAREAWSQELATLEELHHPGADAARARLASVPAVCGKLRAD